MRCIDPVLPHLVGHSNLDPARAGIDLWLTPGSTPRKQGIHPTCISKRALGPQSGRAAGLGSPGSLYKNNSADFQVWIHTSLGTAPDKHQDRHKERPRRGPNPAFRSELWDPKAASRPVWGPQVRLTRTILAIFRCGFTPPRDRARQAPRSAQRAAATGTQPCISKRALGPQSGLKAGLGSPGSLDENNSGDFRVWIHTSSKLRSSTRIDIRKPHATDTA